MTHMDPVADAPLPPDALEPPPRKRGLGRGLAEMEHAGFNVLPDGRRYSGLNSLVWAMLRADETRHAAPQPKALHRLPDPVEDTGPIDLSQIIATPPMPRPRSLSESAAILQARLEHPSEAIRASEPLVVESEPVVEVVAPSRFGKFSSLVDDDEDI